MNYQLGDVVVHQNFGVGKVITIETKRPDGDPCLFYRVNFDKTTIWLPVHENREDRVRPITPKTELSRYRRILRSQPEPLEGDFRSRQTFLEKRLVAGTYAGLCQVVRDLSAYHGKKSLTQFERNLLQNSRAALIREWSVSSGLSIDDASEEIDGCLDKSSL